MRSNSRAGTKWKPSLGLGLAVLAAAAVAAVPTLALADDKAAAPATAGNDVAAHDMGGHDTAVLDAGGLWRELAQVRRATARFRDIDAALEAGYELGWVNGSGVRIITGCVAHPTAGGMGYHYFNKELMDDLAVDPLQPEALVYAPREHGKLKLAAVEWVVRGPDSNPPGPAPPPIPTVLGMEMHILVPPPGPAFYLMHAWVWKYNSAGMFEDWNPKVTCP